MFFLKTRMWLLLLLSLVPFCALFAATAAEITEIHLSQSKTTDETNINIDMNQKVDYRYFILTQPDRLVVDLPQTTFNTNKKDLSGGVIKDLRVGTQKDETLRLVFDLKKPSIVNRFDMNTNGKQGGDKITFMLLPKKQRPQSPVVARDVVIVIDPGHGGKDPGTMGAGGVKEKDVVLAISQKLYADVLQEKGMRVVMTRSDDRYLTLRERLSKAREAKADVFIAVHADAYRNPLSHGVSIYALSLQGATSEAARWIAEKENYSELAGIDLSDKNNVLRSVLIDLSQTGTISASLRLGKEVLTRMGTFADLHYQKVEQARFVVLKSPDIPSILIETGFLSNASEEKKLRNPVYQKRVADAVMAGIKEYFYERPPHDSWIALYGVRYYTVNKGDTLKTIAENYHVSMAQLLKANNLQNGNVQTGQVLRVPASTSVS